MIAVRNIEMELKIGNRVHIVIKIEIDIDHPHTTAMKIESAKEIKVARKGAIASGEKMYGMILQVRYRREATGIKRGWRKGIRKD